MSTSCPGKTIFRRYVVLAVVCSLLLMGFVGVADYYLVTRGTVHLAETHAEEIARGLTKGVLQPLIRNSVQQESITIPQSEMDELENQLKGFLAPFAIVRIQIIDRTATTVFSTARMMIDHPDEEENVLDQVLAGKRISFLSLIHI